MLSALLVLIFVLAISPKQVLHGVFANHTDSQTDCTTSDSDQMSTASFHCGCDSPVVDGSFLMTPGAVESKRLPLPSDTFVVTEQALIFLSSTALFLRGPPACA